MSRRLAAFRITPPVTVMQALSPEHSVEDRPTDRNASRTRCTSTGNSACLPMTRLINALPYRFGSFPWYRARYPGSAGGVRRAVHAQRPRSLFAQRRHHQQQFGEGLQITAVGRGLAQLFQTFFAIDVRPRDPQQNAQQRPSRLQTQQVILHPRPQVGVGSLRVDLHQSLREDAALLCIAQSGEGLLIDQSGIVGAPGRRSETSRTAHSDRPGIFCNAASASRSAWTISCVNSAFFAGSGRNLGAVLKAGVVNK